MNEESAQYQKITVGELLTMCQADQAKSDTEVAQAIGVGDPVYAMIKAGKATLPINCVKPAAAALGLAPDVVLTTWLQDYQPELLATLCDVFHPFPQSEDERRVILELRGQAAGDS